jgi:hypothetical protein
MTRGIRFIGGKEFMLAGRYLTKQEASAVADELRKQWVLVKILKTRHIFGCYSCWVHAAR